MKKPPGDQMIRTGWLFYCLGILSQNGLVTYLFCCYEHPFFAFIRCLSVAYREGKRRRWHIAGREVTPWRNPSCSSRSTSLHISCFRRDQSTIVGCERCRPASSHSTDKSKGTSGNWLRLIPLPRNNALWIGCSRVADMSTA